MYWLHIERFGGMLVALNPLAGKVRLLVWWWGGAPAETKSVADAIGWHEEDESHLWSRRRPVGELGNVNRAVIALIYMKLQAPGDKVQL